jgi:hypothetical protein
MGNAVSAKKRLQEDFERKLNSKNANEGNAERRHLVSTVAARIRSSAPGRRLASAWLHPPAQNIRDVLELSGLVKEAFGVDPTHLGALYVMDRCGAPNPCRPCGLDGAAL